LPQGVGTRKRGKAPGEAEIAVIFCSDGFVAQVNGSIMKDSGQESGRAAGPTAKTSRQERLKQALRENLKRRKSQARDQARELADFTLASPAPGEVARDDDGKPG
jgi:hypothetical protein